MEIRLDLHVHSAFSPDGCMSLEEIVSRARARGLQGVAVCDHERVLTEAILLPEDFLLIPGAEFSTEYGHLLGLFLTAPLETAPFPRLVEAIHRQGGLAVLAHPFQRRRDPGQLGGALPLLDGVEVWNSRANRKNRQANDQARALASRCQLPAFAGSDAHRPREVGNGYVTLQVDSLSLPAVKEALRSGAGRPGGQESPSRCVAMSQLTKLRKTGAPPGAYCKWLLFAAKCCAEDGYRRKGEYRDVHDC